MISTLLSTLPLALPLLLLAGALPWQRRWPTALLLNASAVVIALINALSLPTLAALGLSIERQSFGVLNTEAYAQVMAILVAFLGLVIARYSRNYLRGEPGRDSYLGQFQMTLGAVMLVVLNDHLLVLLAGWTAISLGLHRLLLFYPDRTRAALAAHKKFLLARTAELALLAAVILLYQEFGTWRISDIMTDAANTAPSMAVQVATVLLALVALIKCAQLPVHGWLIQVVESPTPVSALLHAGIINLGGYLLIIMSPLLSVVPAAQWLLLIVAGLTVVFAALVMSTQVSIKVRLAWSTSAQMGLMLVECALGLYELAMLHLVAHSCYKAYVFLNSGDAAQHSLERSQAPRTARPITAWLSALAIASVLVATAALVIGPGGAISPWLLMAAMLTCFLTERGTLDSFAPRFTADALALVLLVAFVGQKLAAGELLPGTAATPMAADLWISALIILLTGAFWLLREQAHRPAVQRLRNLLFAGLYLDEWFTRTTLRVWPLRLPEQAHRKQLNEHSTEAV